MNQISSDAEVADDVQLGVFCAVGAGVRVGEECRIGNHVVIHEGTRIGRGVRIDDGAVLGKLQMRAKAKRHDLAGRAASRGDR